MAKVASIYNSQCLKCDILKKEMIKVGPMVFCPKCFEDEFVQNGSYNTKTGEINTKNKDYQAWLEVYIKFVEKIIKEDNDY